MKINQAQIRVIRAMLRGKAHDACAIALKQAQANSEANEKLVTDAFSKIVKKYEKKLIKGMRPNINNLRRGYSAPCCIDFDEAVVDAVQKECKAALETLPLIGSDRSAAVAIPSLNMVDRWSRRPSTDTSMLEVPASEHEKWRDLARDIDSSFMDGDAKKLAWIISNFK